MHLEIMNEPLQLDLYGFSGFALNKDYAGTAFRLMDRMWQIVKAKDIKNKGLNIWVYETGDKVFAGVELTDVPNNDTGLEYKPVTLTRYARYKHVGPYQLIKQSGNTMTDLLRSKGYDTTLPYIEIYGHWTKDESQLETDLLMSLK